MIAMYLRTKHITKNVFLFAGYIILLLLVISFASSNVAAKPYNLITLDNKTTTVDLGDTDRTVELTIKRSFIPKNETKNGNIETGYNLHITEADNTSREDYKQRYIEFPGINTGKTSNKDVNEYILPLVFKAQKDTYTLKLKINPFAPRSCTVKIQLEADTTAQVKTDYRLVEPKYTRIKVVHIPIEAKPLVFVDSETKGIIRTTPYMEYRLDNDTKWRSCDKSLQQLRGKHTIYIRRSAIGNGGKASLEAVITYNNGSAPLESMKKIDSSKWLQKHLVWLIAGIGAVILILLILNLTLVRRKKLYLLSGKNGICIGNAQNIGRRETQQDSFGISDIKNEKLCIEKGVLGIVADGMGGLSNGAEVSAIVTTSMLNYFNKQIFLSDASIELLNMVTLANRNVNNYLKNNSIGQSGSTVVAAVIKEMNLYWISVGDSRIYLYRNDSLIKVNHEHNYASELDEQVANGIITAEEALNDPQRNALTSYIGLEEIPKIDRNVRQFTLLKGDKIILMSDGVYGSISDEEIASVMEQKAFEAAHKIEAMVINKNKQYQDNLTVVILECC